MSEDRSETLLVAAIATGEQPRGWAWAIYLDADHTLITRSRSLYWSRREAQEAGGDAAATVRRNLQLQASRSMRASGGEVPSARGSSGNDAAGA